MYGMCVDEGYAHQFAGSLVTNSIRGQRGYENCDL